MWISWSVAGAQVLANPSLDGPVPVAIPNTLSATDWTYSGTDVAQVNVPIDCALILANDSTDSGQFARAVAFFDGLSGTDAEQSLTADVSGLIVGVNYLVRFEQNIVRHYGQSSGHWSVTFAGLSLDAPDLVLPATNPEQGTWVAAEVGPFVAVATDDTIELRAHSHDDGSTASSLPLNGCPYSGEQFGTDLLIDGIVIVGDPDQDGLYDDAEALLGTSPFNPDSDGDGLLDGEEGTWYTDPLDEDSDDDGLLDGEEIDEETNPNLPDTDYDGLLDGDERDRNTDPLDPDSDNDGLSDGEEVAQGFDPNDPDSPGGAGTVTVTSDYTDPGPTTTETGTPGPGPVRTGDDPYGKAGCTCDSASARSGAWLAVLALVSSGRRRPRVWPGPPLRPR